jgi:biotin operon repressor
MTPARLLSQLGNSADSARPLGEIAESLGVSLRSVQKASEQAKAAGIPIVTAEGGVYAAVTASDALIAYRQARSRALTQLRGASAIKRTWRRMQQVHQETLWAA